MLLSQSVTECSIVNVVLLLQLAEPTAVLFSASLLSFFNAITHEPRAVLSLEQGLALLVYVLYLQHVFQMSILRLLSDF